MLLFFKNLLVLYLNYEIIQEKKLLITKQEIIIYNVGVLFIDN
jgi:hypothetical protein